MNNNCNVIAEIPIQQPVFRVIFVGEVNIDRLRTMDNLRLNERLLMSETAWLTAVHREEELQRALDVALRSANAADGAP